MVQSALPTVAESRAHLASQSSCRWRVWPTCRHGHEVIAVDGRGAGGDRAGRPLRGVVGVAGDAMLGRDLRPGHLEQVELGGYLEQRVRARDRSGDA